VTEEEHESSLNNENLIGSVRFLTAHKFHSPNNSGVIANIAGLCRSLSTSKGRTLMVQVDPDYNVLHVMKSEPPNNGAVCVTMLSL
jgi:hypothetical protein